MPEIVVKLHSILKKYSKTKQSKYEILKVADYTTVNELIKYYGFAKGEIELVLINGRIARDNEPLDEGTVVEFYPIFGGG